MQLNKYFFLHLYLFGVIKSTEYDLANICVYCLIYTSFVFMMMQAYMLELYQDTLVDLLLPKNAKRSKLEIKKDSKVIHYS